MQNGPELWDAVREAALSVFSDALVAGGCIRDYRLGVPPKDIDVFVAGPSALIVHPDFVHQPVPSDRREEYEGRPYVRFVDDYDFHGIHVQVIGFYTDDEVVAVHGPTLVGDFDFGITRAWYDGQIHETPEFEKDLQDSTITVLRNDRPERAATRARRFMDRHPGRFRLVETNQDLEVLA